MISRSRSCTALNRKKGVAMTTDEAVVLRKFLEENILTLLQDYHNATRLTPRMINVEYVDTLIIGTNERIPVLTGVRVTVEV